MGPFDPIDVTNQDISVNVPVNTQPSVINDILSNLPNIFGGIASIFGNQQQVQQPVQVRQDLTPVYLIGGAIILILLTKK